MNSKEIFYAIYSNGHGFLSAPKYDSRDYLTCKWVMKQNDAYLNSDAHALKSMVLDLDRKYAEGCEIRPVIMDKFVHLDSDLYHFLTRTHYASGLFSWNADLALKFEEIEANAKNLAKEILDGNPIEREVFVSMIEYLNNTKVVVNFLLETNQDDEKEGLEEDLEVLEKIVEKYKLAYEVCGKQISV